MKLTTVFLAALTSHALALPREQPAKAIRGTTETPDADLQYFPSKRAEEQDADLQYFPSKRAEEQDADLQYFPSKRAEEQDADLQYDPSK